MYRFKLIISWDNLLTWTRFVWEVTSSSAAWRARSFTPQHISILFTMNQGWDLLPSWKFWNYVFDSKAFLLSQLMGCRSQLLPCPGMGSFGKRMVKGASRRLMAVTTCPAPPRAAEPTWWAQPTPPQISLRELQPLLLPGWETLHTREICRINKSVWVWISLG